MGDIIILTFKHFLEQSMPPDSLLELLACDTTFQELLGIIFQKLLPLHLETGSAPVAIKIATQIKLSTQDNLYKYDFIMKILKIESLKVELTASMAQ